VKPEDTKVLPFDEAKGARTPAEQRTLDSLQEATETPTPKNPDPQRVVHHGPEIHNPHPEPMSFPVTAFEPSGAVRSINSEQGLISFYNEYNAKGYKMDPNPGWGWKTDDNGQFYKPN
jgi:hypothetical protein